MAIEIPKSEEKRIIKIISLICRRDNCNFNVFPGVNKDGIKIAIKAITKAKATAIKACFLELILLSYHDINCKKYSKK